MKTHSLGADQAGLGGAVVHLAGVAADTVEHVAELGPRTSSVGRLFDAIGALLAGIGQISYEAEAARALPAYARPLFLRMLPEIEITGTFKHRKVDSVAEGFDPSCVDDALYFLDAMSGGYVPLDGALHDRILAGDVRL